MEPTPDPSSDRRVQRTRRALREALITLLARCAWDDISVQDICECADIGRSTFYMHFQNKEELLASGLSDLRLMLREEAAASGKAGTLGFLRGLIAHVGEQRQVFRSVIGRRSGHVVQLRFREMLLQLVEEEFSGLPAAGWQRDAGARYLAGALLECLAWWVEAGTGCPAEELESYFQRLAVPVVAAAAGQESGPVSPEGIA